MIDWLNVLENSIWLVGLAICLATVSYADWQAHATGVRLRVTLETPSYALALLGGLALVGLGVALSAEQWWARLVWALIAIGAAFAGWWVRANPHQA